MLLLGIAVLLLMKVLGASALAAWCFTGSWVAGWATWTWLKIWAVRKIS